MRADDDPYTAVSREGGVQKKGIDLTFFRWIASLFFTYTMVGGIVFALWFVLLTRWKKVEF